MTGLHTGRFKTYAICGGEWVNLMTANSGFVSRMIFYQKYSKLCMHHAIYKRIIRMAMDKMTTRAT